MAPSASFAAIRQSSKTRSRELRGEAGPGGNCDWRVQHECPKRLGDASAEEADDSLKWTSVGALLLIPFLGFAASLARAAEPAVVIPAPAQDMAAPAGGGTQTVVLAGGCFWGVQGVFEHTKGVTQAVSGYSGGKKETAHYQMVGTEHDRPRRVGSGHIRSEADFLRQDFADLFFGRSQPDRAELSGPR